MSKRKTRQQSKRARDGYLRRTYDISEEEYKVLADRFLGGCWICHKKPKPDRNLAVDHDHVRAKAEGVRQSIRGILCFLCNKRLIGRRRREHAHLYHNAAGYLESDLAQDLLAKGE